MDASLLSSLMEPHFEQLYEDNRTDIFLKTINREYSKLADDDQFPTMFVMTIDYISGEIIYSSANSTLPFVVRGDEIIQLEKPEGMHIGFFEDPHYERKKFLFKPEDKILFFSDAVLEINVSGIVNFGYDLIKKIVSDHMNDSENFFKNLIEDLKTENSGFPLSDDTTLILLEQHLEEKIHLTFNNLPQWKKQLESLKTKLRNFGFENREILPLSIALDELSINAFVHGNKVDLKRKVTIIGSVSCRNVEFSIIDEGKGFDPQSIPDPKDILERLLLAGDENNYTHGRGISVAQAYVDTLHFNDEGNSVTITMEKKRREVLFKG